MRWLGRGSWEVVACGRSREVLECLGVPDEMIEAFQAGGGDVLGEPVSEVADLSGIEVWCGGEVVELAHEDEEGRRPLA